MGESLWDHWFRIPDSISLCASFLSCGVYLIFSKTQLKAQSVRDERGLDRWSTQ